MKTLLSILLSAATTSPALAETIPPQGRIDLRVRSVVYDRDEVYRLHGWVGQEIHIEFDAGEDFVALSGGDVEALSIGAERNSLSIKPRAAIVDSNFTIITNRRYYHIAYTAAIARTARDKRDSIYSLRFTYPQDIHEEQGALQSAARLTEANRNTQYGFCGHVRLKPIEASDDGVRTRLRFAEHAEFPAVFVREADGTESLVNFSVHGRDLIIHRIAREFVLRRGKLAGCVVNRGFQ